MNGGWTDVHGAGSQRSDPKQGDPDDYPTGNGPQGDAIRIYNHVRMVRDAEGVTPGETVSVSGTVTFGGTPLCALVLANGQHMFTCGDDAGMYDLQVPVNDDGEIRVFGFVDGLAPFSHTLRPLAATSYDIAMSAATADDFILSVTSSAETTADASQVQITGNVQYLATPVCALILANGSHVYSCDDDGGFDLSVPLNADGQVTVFGFADGFAPFSQTLTP